MKYTSTYLIVFTSILANFSCQRHSNEDRNAEVPKLGIAAQGVSRISFGSCNNAFASNELWDEVIEASAEAWIWGGDIVYADSDEPEQIRKHYNKQLSNPLYGELIASIPVFGTWDDHDYGRNDGGREFSIKTESQQLFLDFLQVEKDDPRRKRDGVYTSHKLYSDGKTIEIIVLDTRYFRSELVPGTEGNRYESTEDLSATILGDAQWIWLEDQLTKSPADLVLLVSSIQAISSEHGFEKWNNMPKERTRLLDAITKTTIPVVVLSGDRHISELSLQQWNDKEILEFTSSGLTHSYTGFKGEPNAYRIGEVVSKPSFGVIDVDWNTNVLKTIMVGDNAEILQQKEFSF